MKSLTKISLVLLASLTMMAGSAMAQTDSTTPATPASPAAPNTPAKPKPATKRYTGKIASVDNDAKTITITTAKGESQVIHITSKAKIKKDSEPATLADATVGMKVSGTLHKDAEGNWAATTVNIGETKHKAAEATAPATTPAAPADNK